MCFDTSSSLLAWSLAFSISIYLYYRNRRFDRWNAAFIITFTLIQLLEAGVWSSLDRPAVNEVLTKLILLALLLQPLVQTNEASREARSGSHEALTYLTYLFAALFIYGLIRVLSAPPHTFHSYKGKGGHLVWEDASSSSFLGSPLITGLYLIGLFIGLVMVQGTAALPLISIGVATALYSYANVKSGNEFGSYWCFTAVAYSIAALFV